MILVLRGSDPRSLTGWFAYLRPERFLSYEHDILSLVLSLSTTGDVR